MVRNLFVSSACLACLASSGVARAQEAAKAEQTPAGATIVLVFDPDRQEAETTVRAIESHLSGTGVVVVEERVSRGRDLLAWLDVAQNRARARGALGVFAIDAEPGADLRVFFSEPDGEATLIRRIRKRQPGPRVGLEEAGIVVRSIVEALRDGGKVGIALPRRAEAPEKLAESSEPRPVEEPAPVETANEAVEPAEAEESSGGEVLYEAPSTRRQGRVSLGLSGVGTSWAAGEGWQFGAALGLQLRIVEGFRVELEYSWFSDLHVSREETSFSLTRHPLALSLTYTPFLGLSPLFQAGTFVDVVSRRTESALENWRTTASDDRWTWGFVGRVGVEASPLNAFHMRLTGGIDVLTRKLEYVVEGGAAQTLLTARSVRPHIQASAQADLW